MEGELTEIACPEDVAGKEQFHEERTKWFEEWMQAKSQPSTLPGDPENVDGVLSKAMELHNKVGLPLNLILNILSQNGAGGAGGGGRDL